MNDAIKGAGQPAPANDTTPRLWTPADLAAFLGYKESTVVRLASQHPEKLPPRVQGLGKPRWVREVCEEWARQAAAPAAPEKPPRRPGRPRNAA